MSLSFSAWCESTFGRPAHPWQRALGEDADPQHRMLRVPTGFGKSHGVLGAWLFHAVHRGDPRWPRRLVWMLPMRTLVEQVEADARAVLGQAALPAGAPRPEVHVLMGGADAGAWHLHPERPAVLVGTQDMLLSRALNRGYGAARARWPVDFGLLSQDALWVLDEVQLMGVGFATALQLAAFRGAQAGLRPTFTWAMSATLQPGWARLSPDTQALADEMALSGLLPGDQALPLWQGSRKPQRLLDPAAPGATAEGIWAAHAELPAHGRTLVVCNTVERARALHAELDKRAKAGGAQLLLLHSRYRGAERRGWGALLRAAPPAAGQVLVATQVIEAGVDLSAELLFTELCPWASLVQRAGRLARRGGEGRAFILPLDPKKASAPYEPAELEATLEALALLPDLSPAALEAFEGAHPERLAALYPFAPAHLLLREELDELFDTTADLSGGDVDVSRYIREGDERDVLVWWAAFERDEQGRARGPGALARPAREALCAVPFLGARDWLCGKKSGGSEPPRLLTARSAFVWDYLDGVWREAQRADLRPGALVVVDAAFGGYDPARGFDPASRAAVPVVAPVQADLQERADAAQDDEGLSQLPWQTVGFHGGEVAREAAQIAAGLGLAGGLPALLHLAGRWHDLGKAHPAFQGAIGDAPAAARPARTDLAKAPAAAWRRGRSPYGLPDPATGHWRPRPGFRHELASALALFDVLRRWAPADHPARLGPLAGAFPGEAPRAGAGEAPGPVEEEVLGLSADDFDLVAFLVCAHHGKLRARLHAAPVDQAAAPRAGSLPIRGVYEGDWLPPVELHGAAGALQLLPESRLSLEPAQLGLSPATGRSWTERVDGLVVRFGPFALAWLEALLRAADVRASMDPTRVDPRLPPSAQEPA
jgi:CRISPR-associated endonuclease/helicase Cas3